MRKPTFPTAEMLTGLLETRKLTHFEFYSLLLQIEHNEILIEAFGITWNPDDITTLGGLNHEFELDEINSAIERVADNIDRAIDRLENIDDNLQEIDKSLVTLNTSVVQHD